MNFLDFLIPKNINDGLNKMQEKQNAVLLDVRTKEEYKEEHIPGSINIPLDRLQAVSKKIPEKGTPLYVHCLSGARSRQAVYILKQSGYTDVTDLGRMHNYHGKTEKGA